MKKSTKGSLAAAAAGALLLGGTGSLALWTATGTVAGGGANGIKTGHLTLTADACTGTGSGTHDWQFSSTQAYTPGTSKVIPGDVISKVCTYTLDLAGDNLKADLSLSGGALGLSTPGVSVTTAKYTIGGTDYTGTHQVTASGPTVVTVTLEVTFNQDATGSMNVTDTLSDLVLTASQA